jgi:hypothetical protein
MIPSSKSKCSLCLHSTSLCESHIIPSFAYKWIKETSATGFVRGGINPDIRKQDGPKLKLLCEKCEVILNKAETLFANNIFYPYVNMELDDYGCATGTVKSIQYNDWLLRFVISIHWRLLVSKDYSTNNKRPAIVIEKLNTIQEEWRQFLLKERNNTGECESHIVFLQNMIAGRGRLPENINKKINYYLLRVIDGTPVSRKKEISIFSKIGPIAFFTTIIPCKLKKTADSRLRMKGTVKTAQHLSHPLLTNFLFITRPNEVMPKMKFSDKQWDKIEASYKKDLRRTVNSMSIKAYESDEILKAMVKNQKIAE